MVVDNGRTSIGDYQRIYAVYYRDFGRLECANTASIYTHKPF